MKKYIDVLIEKAGYGWIALGSFYFLFLATLYLGIWQYLDANEVPANLSGYEGVLTILLSRQFLHILLTLVLASHFLLIVSIWSLKRVSTKLNKLKYHQGDRRKVLLIAGNQTAIKLIDVFQNLGHEVVSLYDQNSKAEGLRYAREKHIPTYTQSSGELREMLRVARDNPKECYYIFIPTEYKNWVDRADQIIRSLRKETKNIRFYRSGIDFDENVDEAEIANLLS